MMEIDRIIHEPVRLRVLILLSGVKEAEFSFILKALQLTNGNLSVHIRKLEDAGYVSMIKTFVGRVPKTMFSITSEGKRALSQYWQAMDQLRNQS
jgi:DNA-binding transcriptional ArsR family regulator